MKLFSRYNRKIYKLKSLNKTMKEDKTSNYFVHVTVYSDKFRRRIKEIAQRAAKNSIEGKIKGLEFLYLGPLQDKKW